jgi:hypothetical protein
VLTQGSTRTGSWFVVVRDADTDVGMGTVAAVELGVLRARIFADQYDPKAIYFSTDPELAGDGNGWRGMSPPEVNQRVRYTPHSCSPMDGWMDQRRFRETVEAFDAVFGREGS